MLIRCVFKFFKKVKILPLDALHKQYASKISDMF